MSNAKIDALINWLLQLSGPGCYLALLASAVYGLYCAILLWRKVQQKRFRPAAADQFMEEVKEFLENKDFDGLAAHCDQPKYWSKAFAQLVLVALSQRDRGLAKCRQFTEAKFEKEILSEIDLRYSWVIAMIKTAPMLGLLGTVTGMVLAFGKLTNATGSGADPQALAGDISIALYTTADGLIIAIPLTIIGGMIQVRITKLVNATQEHLEEFFFLLQAAMTK